MVIFKIGWGNDINMGAYSKVSSQNLTVDSKYSERWIHEKKSNPKLLKVLFLVYDKDYIPHQKMYTLFSKYC